MRANSANIIKIPRDVTKLNFKEMIQNQALVPKYKPVLPPDFLARCLPYLASIPLVYKNGLVDSESTISNFEGLNSPHENVDPDIIKNMVRMLYRFPRSSLIPTAQIRAPKYASLTPIPMYAHKLYNKVPYEKWMKNKYLRTFLGKELEDILSLPTVMLDSKDIQRYRKIAVTIKTGVKAGVQEPFNTWRCNIAGFSLPIFEDSPEYDEDGEEEQYKFVAYPRIAIIIKLQLWLANVQYRVPGTMILDLNDWDHTPEALDAQVADTAEDKDSLWI